MQSENYGHQSDENGMGVTIMMSHQNRYYVQTAIYIKLKTRNIFLIECQIYEEERKSLFESASELSMYFNGISRYYIFFYR